MYIFSGSFIVANASNLEELVHFHHRKEAISDIRLKLSHLKNIKINLLQSLNFFLFKGFHLTEESILQLLRTTTLLISTMYTIANELEFAKELLATSPILIGILQVCKHFKYREN